jgi:hypothetical protein
VTVSASTEAALREAMARLLAGTPQYTDGVITKTTCARRPASAGPP